MFLIPEYVNSIIERLNANGFEAYLAGGCVRDFLMGKIPADYDIATSATPYETKECFFDYPVIETGLIHGTVTVVTRGGNIEITTYRIDGDYKDNRHPEKVEFSKNIKEDLKRRDFTVNAMAYNKKDGLVDLFFGQKHIKEKIIACVGNPDERFKEDALRILRGMRFASVLGFKIEEKTALSIIKNKALLKNISSERIFTEFKKLICGKNASEILYTYREVIGVFIPDFEKISNSIISNIQKCEDALRLAFILSFLKPDEATAILKKLKADNKTVSFVRNVLKALSIELREDKSGIKSFLKENSLEVLMAVIKIKNITENKKIQNLYRIIEEITENKECYSLAQLDLDGNDLMNNLGLSGNAIGAALNKALNGVIDGDVSNKKGELLRFLAKNEKSY